MSADGTSRQPADDNGDIESDESTDEGPAEVLVLKTLSSEASIPCRSGQARKRQLLLAKSQSQLEQQYDQYQYQYQYLLSSMVISEEVHFAVINKLWKRKRTKGGKDMPAGSAFSTAKFVWAKEIIDADAPIPFPCPHHPLPYFLDDSQLQKFTWLLIFYPISLRRP